MDLNYLEEKLNKCSNDCKINNQEYKSLVKNLYEKDKTNCLLDTFLDTLSTEERSYYICNMKYKSFISNYSKAYLELCDWYVGDELPYNLYIKHCKSNLFEGTYLDTKEDIILLYQYFFVALLFEKFTGIKLE